jgi:phosphoribosylformimino-5-aminoimidazole carboxamide ribotide isomerase
MKIIPAIDIIDGKCVRLTQGDYNQKKIYDQSPLEVATDLAAKGIKHLHMVDLDGAKSSSPKNLYTLNQVALETDLKIDFGGGIKSEDSLIQAFRSGADKINIGSLAIRNPLLVKFWIMKYGADKIILSADVKEGYIAVDGWQEKTEMKLFDFINDFSDDGAVNFVCTDISKDGMMEGSCIELYDQILDNFPEIKLTASGGVSSIKEMMTLKEIGVDGVILGKALYEGLVDLEEVVRTFDIV